MDSAQCRRSRDGDVVAAAVLCAVAHFAKGQPLPTGATPAATSAALVLEDWRTEGNPEVAAALSGRSFDEVVAYCEPLVDQLALRLAVALAGSRGELVAEQEHERRSSCLGCRALAMRAAS